MLNHFKQSDKNPFNAIIFNVNTTYLSLGKKTD
jgi:hypothetical protein